MNEKGEVKKVLFSLKESVGFKILVIGVLILALLIPTSMVRSLIGERQVRQGEVVGEISSKWGQKQSVTGPVLTVPYRQVIETGEGKKQTVLRHAHFLPEEFKISGRLQPEIRYRGIYEAVLYQSNLELTGYFPFPQFDAMNVPIDDILWSKAFISLGITDMVGISDQIGAEIGGETVVMNPGIPVSDVIDSGVSAPIVLPQEGEEIPFRFRLSLNGSSGIGFAPVGKVTVAELASSWSSPSFDGSFLPVERSVGPAGFKAKWRVLHLNRNFPQAWADAQYKVQGSTFGVDLFLATDVYQKSMRTAKYAIMFILFTFIAFFFSEVMNKKRVHPIQYLLIGVSLVIFYTLLISVSEHLNFGLAYLISSVLTISLITLYAAGILQHRMLAGMVGGILTILYGYLYILLQLEDYALLMGSIGLFVVLSLIMYLTRKVDWYAIRLEGEPAGE